ncbi:uncharacterized protein RJT20DRAFT_125017 [Scheffersomyces xylosifermentans]|uniref:uncharacterized protein n=1 Tax=Scheffersomyces xylosifermentans TaxID=1304137 RepID=UPI00315DF16E
MEVYISTDFLALFFVSVLVRPSSVMSRLHCKSEPTERDISDTLGTPMLKRVLEKFDLALSISFLGGVFRGVNCEPRTFLVKFR